MENKKRLSSSVFVFPPFYLSYYINDMFHIGCKSESNFYFNVGQEPKTMTICHQYITAPTSTGWRQTRGSDREARVDVILYRQTALEDPTRAEKTIQLETHIEIGK